jgi:transposase-like protein
MTSWDAFVTDGKIHMFLAIDRVSKFTFVEFYEKAGKLNAAAFLEHAIEAFPYRIHTVLPDNGIAFADLPKNRTSRTASSSASTSSAAPASRTASRIS